MLFGGALFPKLFENLRPDSREIGFSAEIALRLRAGGVALFQLSFAVLHRNFFYEVLFYRAL